MTGFHLKKRRSRKNLRSLQTLREKKGTTMVEMLASLLLMSIMLAMAASVLSSASKIFVRLQRVQYAQSILDTTMTELRTATKDAAVYVKVYATGVDTGTDPAILGETGVSGGQSGTALEFVNEQGYTVLLTTEGCEETKLYIGTQEPGTAGVQKALGSGRLLLRYYFRDSVTGTYQYSLDGERTGRAAAEAFGEGFYMKNYLRIRYQIPEGVSDGDSVKAITATVSLYSDAECTKEIAKDVEVLDFRHPVVLETDVTARADMSEGD